MRSVVATGVAILITAFVYTLAQAAELIDDHFMHVAWGRQLLDGRLPVRDMVPLGVPLQYALSVLFEWVFGHRLLSEGVIIAAAFALGAALTFVLATKASGRLWVGVIAAVLQIAIAPRTYGYSKVVLYAAAVVLLWRYIDKPLARRVVGFGVWVAVAFFLRHDHGIYLGLVGLAVFSLRHADDRRTAVQHVTMFGAVCLITVLPYLLYVQLHGGVAAYVRDLRVLAVREYQQNHFDDWPRWPLRSRDAVFRRAATDAATAPISVRWQRDASQETRRVTAARYGLEVPDDRPIGSGRFVLTDTSRDNVLAMLRDPIIEDTAGVDRRDGTIPTQGLWLGSLRILPAIDTAAAAAALLFFAFVASICASVFALLRAQKDFEALPHERLKVAAVVMIAILTAVGFLRQPLEVRIADAVVAPLVLAAWLTGRWLTPGRMPIWSRVARGAVFAMLLVPIVRSVVVVGMVSPRFERLQDWESIWQRLTVSPAFDGWTNGGDAKYQAVRYVRDCTSPDDPLLVLWFAPDLYYYSERPFAGRLGFYLEGYWVSDDDQRMNLEAIERDQPTIVLMQSGREQTDLYTYPRLLAYIKASYHPIGEVTSNDRTSIRVFARNGRSPLSTDPELGWPCYVDAATHVFHQGRPESRKPS